MIYTRLQDVLGVFRLTTLFLYYRYSLEATLNEPKIVPDLRETLTNFHTFYRTGYSSTYLDFDSCHNIIAIILTRRYFLL